MKHKSSLLIQSKPLTGILFGMVFSLPLLHAEEESTVTTTGDEGVALGELVVNGTATRKKEAATAVFGERSVQDTPFSVSVLDSKDLEATQANSLGEAFFGDPSVVTEVSAYASGWGSPIQVRGMELAWDSYRVNGVPSDSWGFEWPLEIMDQVELYKGATGFMYGFGTPGGLVNYRTKKPLDVPYAALTAGFRNKSVWSVGGDFSQRGGKDGWFGYRVNINEEYGTTYNGGDINRLATTISLEGKLRDDLTLTTDLIYLNRNLENESAIIGFYNYGDDSLPKPIDGSKEMSVDGSYWNIEYTMLSTGLTYELNPDWKASLEYHFTHKHSDTKKAWAYLLNREGDYNLNFYQLGGDTDRQFLQAMVQGSFDTGRVSHQVVAGASSLYTREYSGTSNWSTIGSGNINGDYVITNPIPYRSLATDFGSESARTDIFLSDTAEVLPGLSLLAGGRYNTYDQEGGYTTDEITPTYAIIYKPVNELTLYASYMESLEDGGTVGDDNGGAPYSNAGELLEPMISKQYEIGAKYESERWGASLAVFRLERGSNIDRVNGDGTLTLVQDGVTLYQGIEAQGSVKVTEDFTLSAGAMWMDPTYDKLSPESADIEGNQVSGASRIQAVVQASYAVPMVTGLEIHAGTRYYGSNYYDDANSLKLPDYTLVNAGASYTTTLRDHTTIFRADINNLTNKKYWSNAGIGTPISAALSVKVEF
jgi:iron complex outermembrane recepter protein